MAQIKLNAALGLEGTLPAISGQNLTTLNASNISSGTLNSARFSGGKIAQVIEDESTTATTFTDTTYVDVGLQVTITPSATSSKILILANCNGWKCNTGSGGSGQMRIQWDQAGGSFTNVQEYEGHNGYADNEINNISPMYLHSPNTTSASIYKVQAAQLNGFSSGSMRMNNRQNDGGYMRSSIIVMEILA